jgi:hypothetical protein
MELCLYLYNHENTGHAATMMLIQVHSQARRYFFTETERLTQKFLDLFLF